MGTYGTVDDLLVTFTGAPVTAVGGFFWTCDQNLNYTAGNVTLTLNDGSVVTLGPPDTTTFRGFRSTTPITSMLISAGRGTLGAKWPVMDHFIVGSEAPRPTVSDDETTFMAGLTASYVDNFDDQVQGDAPAAINRVGVNGFTYRVGTGPVGSELYVRGGSKFLSTVSSSDDIVVTFSGAPVTAVGCYFFGINSFGDWESGNVTLSLNDGSSVTLASPDMTTFRGFVSPVPITSLRVSDGSGMRRFGMDHLIVGHTGVPFAVSDAYSTDEDTPLTVPAAGVLGNDSDLESDPLTAVKVWDPAHGTVTVNADGSFTYTPTGNWNGSDTFFYKANDGTSDSYPAAVTITVNSLNDAPTVARDFATVTVNEGATAANTGTWGDAEGDTVTLSASVGTVTRNAGGTWSWSLATTDGPAQTQTVTITANDGVAPPVSVTFDLVVNNVAPAVTPPAGQAAVAGVAHTFSLGSFADPGADASWSIWVTWGDSSSTGNGTPTTGTITPRPHTYAAAGNYTVTVKVTDKDGDYGTATFLVTVTDPPQLSVGNVAQDEGNAGTTTFTFTVSLPAPAVETVTFDIATADGTATTAGGDYLARALAGQTIPAGSSSTTFDVTANGDTANEADETFAVAVTNVTNGVAPVAPATGTIRNDDAPVVAADAPTVTVNEGATATNTGTWGTADAHAVTLAASSGTLTQDPGGTWSWSLATTDGPADGRTVTVTATDAHGSRATTFDLVVNNAAPVVTPAAGQAALPNVAHTFDLGSFADLVTDANWALVVDWGDGTAPGTATLAASGALAPRAHTYAGTGTYTVTVTVTDKDGTPGTATFPVTVGAPPQLSVGNVALDEGNAGTTIFTFTVSLPAPAVEAVTFDIATADGTATAAGSDYLARALVGQTIPAGSSSTTFDVTVNGDIGFEPEETFTVAVTNVTNGVAPASPATGTITNDDEGIPPASSVNAIPSPKNVRNFTVSWTAADNLGGSGLTSVRLYYTYNGGAPVLFGTYPAGTTDTPFTSPEGSGNYTFHTVAEDNAGNVEAAPADPDQAVLVSVPTALAFTVQPAGAKVMVALPAVQVSVLDEKGNVVPNGSNSVYLALVNNPTASPLYGVKAKSAVNGVATFSDLRLSRAGKGYTLRATATGLTATVSVPFNIITGCAERLVFLTAPSNTSVGAVIAPAMRVAAVDGLGNVVPSYALPVTIALHCNPGRAVLGGTRSVTPVGGIATFNDVTISRAGTGVTLRAYSPRVTSVVSGGFTVAP